MAQAAPRRGGRRRDGGPEGWGGTGPRLDCRWVQELLRAGRWMAAEGPAGDGLAVQRRILEHTVRGFQAASGTLALLEGEGPERVLRIVAGIDLPEGVVGSRIALGEGILGQVARLDEPVLLNGSVSQDPRFATAGAAPRVRPRPRSAICWPLRVEGRTLGVMSLNRGPDRPPFTQEDLEHGAAMVQLMALVVENARLQEAQARRIRELSELNRRLEQAQIQLMQSEKMAAVGQLAAGVAHEINNPVGYLQSNLGALRDYARTLLGLAERAEEALRALPAGHPARRAWEEAREAADLDFLRQDLEELLEQSGEGLTRVRQIVQDLKEFSHVDETQWQEADLLQGLASTLNIVHNELKYRAEVVRELAPLPPVRCIPSQVNQVLMNLLVNAAQAIEGRGTITLRSGRNGEWVWLEVEDTGCGIPRERLGRIFDPFYTTKPVGKGTGLGLALSASIAQRHGGRIEVDSEPGRGSRFRLWLPREGPAREGEARAAAEAAPAGA